MARPRKVPAVLVEATVKTNGKLADLPSDTSRLGFFYVVLGDAKLSLPVPGQFTSRGQFKEVAGRFARFLEDYIKVGVLEVAPRLCARCKERWSEMPPRSGVLVVHDWHEHQYDPRKIERQREYEDRQRGLVSDGVSDAQSDGVSDALPDAIPTVDSRAPAREPGQRRAPNAERRTENESSPHEEIRRPSRSAAPPQRDDVQALLDRGWKRVSKAQRRTLDEIAERHVAGFAAEVIRATPGELDPLAAVMSADRIWQDAERRRITADEAAWAKVKATERAEVAEVAANPPDWLLPLIGPKVPA